MKFHSMNQGPPNVVIKYYVIGILTLFFVISYLLIHFTTYEKENSDFINNGIENLKDDRPKINNFVVHKQNTKRQTYYIDSKRSYSSIEKVGDYIFKMTDYKLEASFKKNTSINSGALLPSIPFSFDKGHVLELSRSDDGKPSSNYFIHLIDLHNPNHTLSILDIGEIVPISATILNNKMYVVDKDRFTLYSFNITSNSTKLLFNSQITYSDALVGLGISSITNDGKELVISNNYKKLFFVDPSSLLITRNVDVVFKNQTLFDHLETIVYSNGKFFGCNEGIFVIDAVTFEVESFFGVDEVSMYDYSLSDEMFIDLKDLKPNRSITPTAIYYSQEENAIYITGKYWNAVHKIVDYKKLKNDSLKSRLSTK